MPHARIFGKAGCPYTANAREAYRKQGYQIEYFDVEEDEARMAEMVKLSGVRRAVPVIEGEVKVTVGYGGS